MAPNTRLGRDVAVEVLPGEPVAESLGSRPLRPRGEGHLVLTHPTSACFSTSGVTAMSTTSWRILRVSDPGWRRNER